MTTVYVAGPMTGYDNYNYPAFHAAVADLRARGIDAVSTAHDANGVAVDPPTPEEAKSWEYYVRLALRMVLDSDAIALLPGWEESTGALLEVEVAKALNMPVKTVAKMLEESI